MKNNNRSTNRNTMAAGGIMLGLTLGLAVPLSITAGCASTPSGAQRMDSTVSSIASVQSLIEDGQSQLDELMMLMDGLEGAENIDRQFRDFERELRGLERIAERVHSEQVSLQTQAAAHATQWRSEAETLSGERAQQISQDRRQDFNRAVNNVSNALDNLRSEYDPFLEKARDLSQLLSNDLTVRGIQSTRPVRQNVMNLASDLRSQSEDSLRTISRAREEFSR